MIQNLSDAELVHHVDNKPSATPLERELANRVDALLQVMTALREHIEGRIEDDML